MNTTIEVKHKVPTTVSTIEITLPHYFKTGKHWTKYCCMNEKGQLMMINNNQGYYSIDVRPFEDMDDIGEALEREFCESTYMPIDEGIFMHHFSAVHREVFYMVNPQLKQND
jgi:hypothetical protein